MNPSNGTLKHAQLRVPLLIQVRNTGPPRFIKNITDIVVKVGEAKLLEIPQIADPDSDDKYKKTVYFGDASQFIGGVWPKFTILPTNNQSHPGTYEIIINLSDDNPLKL